MRADRSRQVEKGQKGTLTDRQRARYTGATMTAKPILNGRQAAEKLGCNTKTLRRQVREGRALVPPIPGSKPPKWRSADIEAMLAGDN